MKIVYKLLIPTVLILLVGFYILFFRIISTQEQVMSNLHLSTKTLLIKQLEERKNVQLKFLKNFYESTAKSIANLAGGFVVNFDEEGLRKKIEFYLLKEDSIKAVTIFDNLGDGKHYFLVLYRDINGEIKTSKNLEPFLKKFKFLKEEIFSENEKIGFMQLFYDDEGSVMMTQIKEAYAKANREFKLYEKEIQIRAKKLKTESSLILTGVLVAVIAFIVFLFYKFVINPLNIVKKGLNSFFLFLQNKTASTETINIDSRDEFGEMARSLSENIEVSAMLHEQIFELNTNLEEKIKQRTRELDEKTQKVETLLDNADQGFLSFGADLTVDDEYSKECKEIFAKEIAGENIVDLLHEESSKREFFASTLISLMKEKNTHKIKTIISLLQNEFLINKKAIQVKYKLLEDKTFMLILTDITANKKLEKKVNREKNTLKMIVSVVSNSDLFFEVCDEFNGFVRKREEMIDYSKTSLYNATELYRSIHTFKGLFSQNEMLNIVKELHQLESELSTILANQHASNDYLDALLQKSDFKAWLEKDLKVIKEILGNEFFNKKGKIIVNEKVLLDIEHKLINIASNSDLSEVGEVVTEIQKLKNRSVYSMLAGYPKLLNQLSERLEKSIYPLEIIVDKELKIEDRFRAFFKSLIHVFRNSIDHGIEDMDTRYALGKDDVGTVSCMVTLKNNNLVIVIADDGSGLNFDKIKNRAQALGIETSGKDQKELSELIFSDRFTTKSEVSEVSGRGVGMAVVKKEVELLEGEIIVTSEEKVGTTFEFVIPL